MQLTHQLTINSTLINQQMHNI